MSLQKCKQESSGHFLDSVFLWVCFLFFFSHLWDVQQQIIFIHLEQKGRLAMLNFTWALCFQKAATVEKSSYSFRFWERANLPGPVCPYLFGAKTGLLFLNDWEKTLSILPRDSHKTWDDSLIYFPLPRLPSLHFKCSSLKSFSQLQKA